MLRRVAIAEAVAEDEAVDARKVEDHEVAKRRRVGARLANVALELNNEAD